ncbi:MAG: S8 family serine peptidase [Gaiellaceae bacterium]
MRMPLRPRAWALPGALAVAAALLVSGAAGAEEPSVTGAAGWQGLLGDRPSAQLGGRWIVVLEKQSLADRVRAAGGAATEQQERAWTKAARKAQADVIARLAFRGAPVEPENVYLRTFNGFAASLDARALAVIERDPGVAGVFPVRAAVPAATGTDLADEAFGPASGRRAGIGIPGFDGTGVTVALLDTGVDRTHPYLQGRLLPGIDVLDPGSDASPKQNPTSPGRPERHGTELAGLVVGNRGPAGLRGVAPGARLLPIRVAGWQPDASGGVSVYGRTDQILAGLELAVDPNEDGDAHDASRIALVGVVEPFASFADGPLARAAEGALALDMLVVAPAGNDGPGGPSYGSVGGPGGAPTVLTVGASDARRHSPTVHVLLRAGLEVLLDGEQPLGGAVGPPDSATFPVEAVPRTAAVVVGGQGSFSRLFGRGGYSTVAGSAALLPNGTSSPEAVRELVTAGARAVLVDGALPAGSLGIDEPIEVPVLGLSHRVATAVRVVLARGIPVTLSVGAAAFEDNPDTAAIAPFSSEGLALDGGVKPELAAAGVGLATSDPGRNQGGTARYGAISGTSAAAAVVAGAAATLAQARPDLDAAALKAALVATARPLGPVGEGGAGLVDPSAAAAAEIVADPPAVGLGTALAEDSVVRRTITLRNVSTRSLRVEIDPGRGDAADTTVAAVPRALRLRPGASTEVIVTAAVPLLPRAPAALNGVLRIRVEGGSTVRVPWSIAVPVTGKRLLGTVRISRRSFVPSDAQPTVLTIVAGRIDGTADRPQLLPLERIEVQLVRGEKVVGSLARLRNVLPGRYSFGITGRGPGGRRLRPGPFSLRVVATPVGGGATDQRTIPFTVTRPKPPS